MRPLPVLLVALLVALPTAPAWADDAMALPPLDVRGDRPPPPPEGVTRTVGRAAAEERGARGVAEALAVDPAVQVRSDDRGEPSFTLRGFEGRELRLTMDGVPLDLTYDGQAELLPLPLSWLKEAEISKGPASVRDGAGGPGGAVRLRLREPGEGPLLEARAELAPREAALLDAFHAGRAGPFAWVVGGGLERRTQWPLSTRYDATSTQGRGWRDNADRAFEHGLVRFAATVAPRHRLTCTAGLTDGHWGVPPSTAELQPRWWRFNEWRSALVSLRYEGQPTDDFGITATVWGDGDDNVLDSYDDGRYATQQKSVAFHSTYADRAVGGDVLLAAGPWELPVGQLDATLRTTAAFAHHSGRPDRGAATQEAAAVRASAEPELRWALPDLLQLTLQGAFTEELPTTNGGGGRAFGAGFLAGAELRPVPALSVVVDAGRAVRFPTLKERYSVALGTRAPAPDLVPESAWTVRAGFAWRIARWLTWSATGFDSEVRDYLEAVQTGDGSQQLRNAGQARLAGAETDVALTPLEGLRVTAGYAFLHARRNGSPADEATLFHRPAHRATAEVEWSPWPWLSGAADVEVVGAQDSQDLYGRRRVTLGAYARLDLRVALRWGEVAEAWLQVRNVLDANYQTTFGFPEPGREVWVGLALRAPALRGL